MTETTSRSETSTDGELVRFDVAVRIVHWSTAALFLIALATATVLYVDAFSALVGRRTLMKNLHVYSGLLLPVPLLVGYLGPWRDGLRRDIRRLARWQTADWKWLRHPLHHAGFERGKFNGGQKVFAAVAAGSIAVLLLTGSVMTWPDPFPDSTRNGATFVHDVLWLVMGVLILGHVYRAMSEPAMFRSMLSGRIRASWARRRQPDWYAEVDGSRDPDG